MNDHFLIIKPWITEKSTDLNAIRKYVFMVKPSATKNEIRKAVKTVYKVDVTDVAVILNKGKQKRFRGIRHASSGYKKAIVTLEKGQTIDLGR